MVVDLESKPCHSALSFTHLSHTYDTENGVTRPDGNKVIARGCAKNFTKSLEQKMRGKVYHCHTNLCNSALHLMGNLGLMAMSFALVLEYVFACP